MEELISLLTQFNEILKTSNSLFRIFTYFR